MGLLSGTRCFFYFAEILGWAFCFLVCVGSESVFRPPCCTRLVESIRLGERGRARRDSTLAVARHGRQTNCIACTHSLFPVGTCALFCQVATGVACIGIWHLDRTGGLGSLRWMDGDYHSRLTPCSLALGFLWMGSFVLGRGLAWTSFVGLIQGRCTT